MARRTWVVYATCVVCSLLIAACANESESGGGDNWAGVCIDGDGDGYGFQCSLGADCDDRDRSVHADCRGCTTPREGCDCSPGSAPLACTVSPELTRAGALLCKEGERYCRDGKWSGCEGISSFLARPPSEFVPSKLQALTGDAGVSCASAACNPDCYLVEGDKGYDGGTDAAVVSTPTGGLTLHQTPGSTPVVADAGVVDDYDCTPGVTPDGSVPDLDCDHIPDSWDPYPGDVPFETSHKSVFMELDPGQSASEDIDITFSTPAADVYFYLDMTATMTDERQKLLDSLTKDEQLPTSWATKDCADRDFDGVPDNYLKKLGVVGAIACMIRDARFGTGFFRDVPFSPHAVFDYEAFENKMDITNDISALTGAIASFTNRGGTSDAEGGMQGLWSLVTGKEWYVGWNRPGTPARSYTCPAGTWGGACFREKAMPIVVHVTDEQMYNGPPTTAGSSAASHVTYGTEFNGVMHSASIINAGTGDRYAVTNGGERLSAPQDFGNINGQLITYTGDTSKMTSDHSFIDTGACGSGSAWSASSQSAGDAAFKFTVGPGPSRNVMISSSGSRFASSVMLLGAVPAISATESTGNGTFDTAHNVGIIQAGTRQLFKGNTAAHPSVYSREFLTGVSGGVPMTSGCYANNSAGELAPASVHKFRLGANMNVRITATGNNLNAALYRGGALEPTNTKMSELDCGAGTSPNCNDKIGQHDVGDVVGKHFHYISGNTAAAGLTNDYAAHFSTCGGDYSGTRDQAFDFSVSQTTTVRIETAGTGASSLATGWQHGISLVKKPTVASTSTFAVPNAQTSLASPYVIYESNITSTTGEWVRYTGSVASDTPTFLQSEVGGATSNVCHNNNAGGPDAGKDVVFRFDVAATQKYEFETVPASPATGYKTWLSLHKGTIARSPVVPSTNGAEQDASYQDLGTADGNQIVVTNGQMETRLRNTTPTVTGDYCGSTGNNSPTGGRDAAFRIWVPTSTTLKFTTVNSAGTKGTVPAFDSYLAVYRGSISDGNRVSGNCPSPGLFGFGDDPNQSGNGWTKSVAVTGGNYYFVVVKEWQYAGTLSSTQGKYGLIIEDTRFTGSFVSCDAGSATNTQYSRIAATLSPGTYYLVLKGPTSSAATDFSLNVRKTPASASGLTVQQCANSASDRAVIERTLTPGDYTVIVKGKMLENCSFFICNDDPQSGTYDLTIRDVAAAPVPVACFNTANSTSMTASGLTRLDASNNPIDYYLVTRANTAGASYQVMIEDASLGGVPNAVQCANAGGLVSKNGQLTRSLAPGTYYAVLKGTTSSDNGMYQMTIGDASNAANSTFVPKSWQADIKPQLLSRNMKVITVASVGVGSVLVPNASTGSSGYKQSFVLAKDTGAPTKSATNTYQINVDGSGMGTEVVSAISDLVAQVTMDLGVQLSARPGFEAPPKPFAFGSKALARPTGNCTGGRSADQTKHLSCGPGAKPAFTVTIGNPLVPNNVPLSSDSKGGYTMQLELVGTVGARTYTVDTIPVYIIPKDVIPPATIPAQYAASGSFEQTIASSCTGTDVPTWSSLYWNATLPTGTSIAWKICTNDGATPCTPLLAGTASSSGVACTPANAPVKCPNGYCASSGVCEEVVGPSCTSSASCGIGGTCAADNKCRWNQNPIDIRPALTEGMQGKRFARVQLTLNSSADRLKAPTVNSWQLDYRCGPGV